MSWEFNKIEPVFIQIVARIRSDILTGKYKSDEQIPSVRQIALEASVNPNTVQRALSELESEGILQARGTVGRFVTSDEKVLEDARIKMKNRVLSSIIREARSVGITDEEIIDYIKKGGEDNG